MFWKPLKLWELFKLNSSWLFWVETSGNRQFKFNWSCTVPWRAFNYDLVEEINVSRSIMLKILLSSWSTVLLMIFQKTIKRFKLWHFSLSFLSFASLNDPPLATPNNDISIIMLCFHVGKKSKAERRDEKYQNNLCRKSLLLDAWHIIFGAMTLRACIFLIFVFFSGSPEWDFNVQLRCGCISKAIKFPSICDLKWVPSLLCHRQLDASKRRIENFYDEIAITETAQHESLSSFCFCFFIKKKGF